VNVYYVKDGRLLSHQKTGVDIPRSQKLSQLTAGFNAVEFSVPTGEQLLVYVHVKNLFAGSPALSYPIIQDPALPAENRVYSILLPILSAIAGIFCLMSFFFFFFIREKAYLFFALYTLFLSQHYLILHPDVPFINFYIPEHPQLVHGFWSLLTLGGFIFFCLFGK
jgi:hypothetical protein